MDGTQNCNCINIEKLKLISVCVDDTNYNNDFHACGYLSSNSNSSLTPNIISRGEIATLRTHDSEVTHLYFKGKVNDKSDIVLKINNVKYTFKYGNYGLGLTAFFYYGSIFTHDNVGKFDIEVLY